MPLQHVPHIPTADEAAAIVARRRAAEKKALRRREARRQVRLAAMRAADEARAVRQRLSPIEQKILIPGAIAEIVARGIAHMALGAARALHRAYATHRETREASLLGLPTPAQLEAAWVPPRRSLQQVLFIGSKLVDLSASHPDTREWTTDANGKRRLTGRAGGLKRYFAQHCPSVRYSTAMRYRQLALRLLRVLGTPAAIPLEWLLSSKNATSLTADAQLAAAIRAGRRKLWELLADIRSQRELTRVLDRNLDPARLPNARRNSDPVRDAAACEAVFAQHEARLRSAVVSGKPLTSDEKAAWKLLQRLERLTERSVKPCPEIPPKLPPVSGNYGRTARPNG